MANCPECDKEMKQSSIKRHMESQHGAAASSTSTSRTYSDTTDDGTMGGQIARALDRNSEGILADSTLIKGTPSLPNTQFVWDEDRKLTMILGNGLRAVRKIGDKRMYEVLK